MTARDATKTSDLKKGRRFTAAKQFRPKQEEPKQITDHALLRYIERVLGVDVEALRLTMLTPAQLKVAAAMQQGELPIGGGHYVRVNNGRIVTIL